MAAPGQPGTKMEGSGRGMAKESETKHVFDALDHNERARPVSSECGDTQLVSTKKTKQKKMRQFF